VVHLRHVRGFPAAALTTMRPLSLPPGPAHLAKRDIRLRPATAADADFLRDLYVAGRWPEMAVTGWPDTVATAFLQDQHRLQVTHYETHYPDAQRLVIECAGRSAGKLILLDMETEIRIVDIGLMPAFRGQGIGSALVTWAQDIARSLGRAKVSLHVDPHNPAKHVYQSLGFQVVEARGMHELMEWTAEPAVASN
jgi:ribosomal protein S18 acetylase RimI-like enzyme